MEGLTSEGAKSESMATTFERNQIYVAEAYAVGVFAKMIAQSTFPHYL